MANSSAKLREQLLTGSGKADKTPPVADGVLSVTPDSGDIVQWRSTSVLDAAETSSSYLDDDDGPKPHELYGKFTWRIENFSEISKRELRSNIFDVGNYKWYILVYPQGCDVCNHLSLFLCVADYDKLLPGWSHFAQFTIAVVNKDPKKSKYSDTLHRFCKKEHDWGWKKFMEIGKVLDGFTVADTLVIKAQVQVILDKPNKPFRCLDPQYRRELVRVYLTNVEGVCRRFCDDKRARLLWVREEAEKFKAFWASLSSESQRKQLTEKGEAILKGIVKQFFNEKEVTSTLVMDALYSGCKQIEDHSSNFSRGKCSDSPPMVMIKADRNVFMLHGDIMEIADKACKDFIPAAKGDDKMLAGSDGLALRSGQEDDYRRDSIERDEKRLAELGRKTVEMYVISHIFIEKLEIAYREAEALKRQDQLIKEEFEMQLMEETRMKAQAEKDKEKKAKKKERMKQKKEAEKAKRDAEEAEKRRQEEIKRQEQERKQREAAALEKKRQEEALALQQQQQQAKQAQQRAQKAKEEAQRQAQQREREAAAAQQAASSSAAAQQAQQQARARQASQQQAASSGPASGGNAARPAAAVLSLQAIAQQAATSSKPSSAPQTSAAGHLHARNQPSAVALSTPASAAAAAPSSSAAPAGTTDLRSCTSHSSRSSHGRMEAVDADSSDDSTSSQEVGTVKQAKGGVSASGTDSDTDSDTDSRSALEEEVSHLRVRVRQLERQLAAREAEISKRDTEIYALRAQLSELQPTELADRVKEAGSKGAAGAKEAPRSSHARAESSMSATSFEKDAAAGDFALQGSSSLSAPSAGVLDAAAAAPAGKAEPGSGAAATNGPSTRDSKEAMLPPPPAVAAATTLPPAVPSAAGRRITAAPGVGVSPALQAAGYDPSSSMHMQSLGGRPQPNGPHAGQGQRMNAGGPQQQGGQGAGAQGRGHGDHYTQPASPSLGAPPPPAVAATPASSASGPPEPAINPAMMRSGSANLPPGSAHQAAAYGHHPAMAAAAANGRPRAGSAMDAASTGKDGSAASWGAAQTAQTGGGMPGSLGQHAGVPGLQAVMAAQQEQSGSSAVPSYRNAAASVMASNAAAAHMAQQSAMVSAGSGAPPANVGMPVSPSSAAHKALAGAQGQGAGEDAASAASNHMQRHLNHAAPEYNAGGARQFMPAQRAGMATYGQVPAAKQAQARQAQQPTHMDSPGLDDFAHMGLIDDLLTE